MPLRRSMTSRDPAEEHRASTPLELLFDLTFVVAVAHVYVVFGAAAATGAGLAVAVDQRLHHSAFTDAQAGFAITIPVSLYVLALWALHFRHKPPGLLRVTAVPAAVALILLASDSAQPVLVTGGLLAALVAGSVLAHRDVRPLSSR